jgi:hypothetical protein
MQLNLKDLVEKLKEEGGDFPDRDLLVTAFMSETQRRYWLLIKDREGVIDFIKENRKSMYVAHLKASLLLAKIGVRVEEV